MTESEYQELLTRGSAIRICPTCKGAKVVGQFCVCGTCHGSGEVCVSSSPQVDLVRELGRTFGGGVNGQRIVRKVW